MNGSQILWLVLLAINSANAGVIIYVMKVEPVKRNAGTVFGLAIAMAMVVWSFVRLSGML